MECPGPWTHRSWIFPRDPHFADKAGRGLDLKTSIAPFGRPVRQVMSREPYRSTARVLWVVDNGSSHRGERCQQRLARQWPNLIVVHTPIHASWLSQIEIYFSIVQRKVLTPNDIDSLTALEDRLLAFQCHYQSAAKPFPWRFTRQDLASLAACPKAA